jgi:Ca2+-binding RTX toxin-like protein
VGAGYDIFEGVDAAMLFYGGAGDDAVLVSNNGQSDVFAGGEGNDTLDLSNATLDVTIDLESGNVTSLEIGHDVISGFEQVIGGSGNDHFEVGAQAVTLTGGAGDDTFSFAVPLSDIADRPQIIHDIMDFLVGDRVLVQEYELSTRGREDAEDRFQFYYRDMEEEQEELRLRIRYDTEDDQEYVVD